MLKKVLDKRIDLQQFLFIRGFLITDKEITDTNNFPFYNNWRQEKHGQYWYMAHNLTGMNIYTDDDGKVFFLFGHAYNPITMQYYDMNIRVVNMKETNFRAFALNVIFTINSILPF